MGKSMELSEKNALGMLNNVIENETIITSFILSQKNKDNFSKMLNFISDHEDTILLSYDEDDRKITFYLNSDNLSRFIYYLDINTKINTFIASTLYFSCEGLSIYTAIIDNGLYTERVFYKSYDEEFETKLEVLSVPVMNVFCNDLEQFRTEKEDFDYYKDNGYVECE